MVTAVNNLTEDKKAELIDKYGLSVKHDPPKDNLFQGDFGFSINYPTLLMLAIVVLAAVFLLYIFFKKRKV
ncbi:hypothetical protein [Paenibacillus typhae]|uniref:Uncharacterized protein n=1 Tax=Paenibacillus typhae TaxID=1174501 RepID=A0A1G8PC89_9BACL|nr:hypothetical protein [Paenibacillus typhae]SDI89928.1 hypothetical protein SAMN05216192_109155 [Paenibacillus typhae]